MSLEKEIPLYGRGISFSAFDALFDTDSDILAKLRARIFYEWNDESF